MRLATVVSLRALFVTTWVAVSVGCTLQPKPLTTEKLLQTAAADQARNQAEVPALGGALTLAEALARALKFNLDHRSKMLEQSYAAGALSASYYDLLPKLTAGLSYESRDSDLTRRSVDSITGAPDNAHPFISSDRNHTLTQLGLSWSLLDFGFSYYNAKEQADRVLIASERRRKAMHQLMQSVQAAYWRALSAQKLRDQTQSTIEQAEAALRDARSAETEQLRSPVEALRYQRALLENLRTLEGVQQELSVARVELAGLINLPPGGDYVLAESDADEQLPQISASIDDLESTALANNAELREENYNVRIATLEARKALLKLLPGISLDYAWKRDTDNFLVNGTWTEAGAQVAANLVCLASYPQQRALGKAGERLARARRLAVQMALITQVHIAAEQFEGARRQFFRADAIWQVDNRLLTLSEKGQIAQTESRLAQIASRTAAILSLLRRYQTLANLHAAAGKMQSTIGADPQIGSLDGLPLADLTQQMQQTLGDWKNFKASQSPDATAAEAAVAPAAPPPAPLESPQ